jgi:hypothetical protein
MPTNILQQVETYQRSGLAFLINSFAFINKANKKFKNFDKIEANLGDTVTFDLPPRFTTNSTLVATFQDSEQRVQSLTVDQAYNTAYSFSAQEFIFNAEDYMDRWGKAAVSELGTHIESNVAENAITNTYRFFGDGINQIDSYEKLAQALAYFRNYGAASANTCGFISDIAVPEIIGTGLSEFAINRNNKDAMSWELGPFSKAEWYQSNLLPTHIAGDEGQQASTLVVTGVTTDPDGGISAITVSGAVGTTDSIKENDLLQFQDGVTGVTDVRYRTFIGHKPSENPVQVRATADAVGAAGSVTIPIAPKLYSAAGRNQNVTTAIVNNMELKALPSHRAGVIYSGNALYLAMPQLPEEVPFPTARKIDPDSGASLRMYYGSKFGQNEHGFVNDQIWGSSLVPEYAMRLVFPL